MLNLALSLSFLTSGDLGAKAVSAATTDQMHNITRRTAIARFLELQSERHSQVIEK